MTQNVLVRVCKRFDVYLIGLLMVVSAFGLQIPSNAIAAIACQGSNWHFVGTNPQFEPFFGVKANITTRNPALCGNPGQFSAAWVMVASNFSINGYAQAGYIRFWNQTNVLKYSEYRQNSSIAYVRNTYGQPGTANLYKVVYNFSTDRLDIWIDSTKVATTNFSPTVAWGNPTQSAWNHQFEGETYDNGTDMPGTPSAQTYFTNMGIKASRDYEIWSSVTSGVSKQGDPLNRYDVAKDNNSQIRIWTK